MKSKITIKRLLLILITVISLIPFCLSLVNSLTEAQVQNNLQLSQTNLMLEATTLQSEGNSNQASLALLLLGKDPYQVATEQYQEAIAEIDKNQQKIQANLSALQEVINTKDPTDIVSIVEANPAQVKVLQASLQTVTLNRQKAALNLGLLAQQQGKDALARQQWQDIIALEVTNSQLLPIQKTAEILLQLWDQSPQISPDAQTILEKNLSGWFRDRALTQFYQVRQERSQLQQLQQEEQERAKQAFLKLILLSVLPVLGGSLGIGLLLVLLLQWFLKKDQAILALNTLTAWQTPWDWEIIWQVLGIGFFFLGQIGLPLILSLIHLDASSLSLRGKAIYVLSSYLAMTLGGLSVLYFSLKPFFPLAADWFSFRWQSRWWLWGLGGYLTALPLVVLVSLINQQFWQGQGGSNPLLFLALEAQDKVVLIIFFFTASIAAPFFEEIIFRGFLLPSLTRYLPVSGAIILSSFVFAIAHLNLSEVLPLAILGMVLGTVYARSRNLLASMLLHSLWNSGTLISLFILGSAG
jgi:membrane protease YdiL (CAAX protease family)